MSSDDHLTIAYRGICDPALLVRFDFLTSKRPCRLPGTMIASSGVEKRSFEEKVDALSQLPERVSAVEAKLGDLHGEFVSFRIEVRREFAKINDRFARVDDHFVQIDHRFAQIDGQFAALGNEMREGDEETRRQMRVLHEDLIARLALIQESRSKRPRR